MAILWVVMSFCVPVGNGQLSIQIDHYVGQKVMELDTVYYRNALGQQFTVTKFKYYISNLSLQSVAGKTVKLDEYFLINEEEPVSKRFDWANIPEGAYSDISFVLGVDSVHNLTGLQTGALDPINAMFWTWNTGYIFLKLEGKSPASTSSGNIFEYHIGGFKAPANSIRTITLHFSKPLIISNNGTHLLHLKADALEVLQGPTTIDFSKLSSVTDAHNAPMVANNYMDMFSVIDDAK